MYTPWCNACTNAFMHAMYVCMRAAMHVCMRMRMFAYLVYLYACARWMYVRASVYACNHICMRCKCACIFAWARAHNLCVHVCGGSMCGMQCRVPQRRVISCLVMCCFCVWVQYMLACMYVFGCVCVFIFVVHVHACAHGSTHLMDSCINVRAGVRASMYACKYVCMYV